jgi:uracil-DNA glycosylase family 4
MPTGPSPLEILNARIVACNRCSRLRTYCAEVARAKRRAYADCTYWGQPVPSFGALNAEESARILVLGLAPGAHGSNRTGRMFTGDGSGDFLFPTLFEAGLASQPKASGRDDGMQLHDLWISAVVRCAPPGNKPLPEEQRNCAPWLVEEIALLQNLHVVVCLGKIAFDGFLSYAVRAARIPARAGFTFGHGAEFKLPDGLTVMASYHPSLQNTNTGKLTRAMFLAIFKRARELAEKQGSVVSGQ